MRCNVRTVSGSDWLSGPSGSTCVGRAGLGWAQLSLVAAHQSSDHNIGK